MFNSSLTCDTRRAFSLPRSTCLVNSVGESTIPTEPGWMHADDSLTDISAETDAARSSSAQSIMIIYGTGEAANTLAASNIDVTGVDLTPDVALAARFARHQVANKSSYVERVVEEIIETERTYVRDLGQIIQVTSLT